jgi:hypothetical protein
MSAFGRRIVPMVLSDCRQRSLSCCEGGVIGEVVLGVDVEGEEGVGIPVADAKDVVGAAGAETGGAIKAGVGVAAGGVVLVSLDKGGGTEADLACVGAVEELLLFDLASTLPKSGL